MSDSDASYEYDSDAEYDYGSDGGGSDDQDDVAIKIENAYYASAISQHPCVLCLAWGWQSRCQQRLGQRRRKAWPAREWQRLCFAAAAVAVGSRTTAAGAPAAASILLLRLTQLHNRSCCGQLCSCTSPQQCWYGAAMEQRC